MAVTALKIPVKKPAAKPKLTPQQIAHQQDYAARHPQHARANGVKIPKVVTPTPAAPTPPPVIQPVPADNIAGATPPTGPTAGSDANTMFPNTRMFEPENYQGSPLYQFQVKEGLKQVGNSLAARGLRDSGRGIQEELDVPMRAAAQDTDRMTRIATENADRLQKIQSDEALRLERQGNNQWNRIYDTASLMAAQSPWNAALAGLNSTADITKDQGNAQANFLKDFYRRVIASGGGGGGGGRGGGSAGPAPIPVPNAPDFSNITPTQIGGDYSSNTGWLNLLTKGLSSFF